MYRASAGDCGACSLKSRCTQAPRRGFARHLYEEALNRIQQRVTPEVMRLRRCTVEHSFAMIKYRIFGHLRLLMRGLSGARVEIGLATMAYNLKRIANVLGATKLPLLCKTREGYQNLCRLITRFKIRETMERHAAGLEVVTKLSSGDGMAPHDSIPAQGAMNYALILEQKLRSHLSARDSLLRRGCRANTFPNLPVPNSRALSTSFSASDAPSRKLNALAAWSST